MSAFTKYLSICFIIMSFGLSAQDYNVTMVPLDQDDKLAGSRINSVHQDKNGYIWMLAEDGVARYDGHQYRWFNKANSKLRDIPRPHQIVEDAEGYIWLNQHNKIDLIHRTTFEVVHFEDKFEEFAGVFGRIKMLQLPDYSILVSFGTTGKSSKTYKYHPDKGMKEVPFLKGVSLGKILLVKNTVWIPQKKNKWVNYDLDTGEKLYEFKEPEGLKLFTGVVGNNLPRGLFFHINADLVILYEFVDNELKEITKFPSTSTSKNNLREKLYYHDPSGLILIMLKEGLGYYDLKNKKLGTFQTYQDKETITFSKISETDNQGELWGVSQDDIRLIKITDARFKKLLTVTNRGRGLWVNQDFITGSRFIEYFDNPNTYQEIPYDRTLGAEPNIKDELWKISRAGITNIYSDDGIIHPPILYSKELEDTDYQYTSWTILRDKNGRWWSGVQGNRGLIVSGKNNKDSLYSFKKYNEFEQLERSNVIHLIEDGDYVWAASNFGLYLVHKEDGVKHRYASDMPKDYQLPLDNVYFIYKDKNNVYWAATNADGLIRFELDKDKKVSSYKQFTTNEGLSSNVLYAIIEDDKENLWISSLNGLSCFIKKTENIQTYFQVDGLPATEFNRASYAKGPDGRIYFGSTKGVISFHPDEVFNKSDKNISLTITQFEKYNKSKKEFADYTAQLIEKQKIQYLPSDGVMSLSVSTLSYFNSKQIQYAYKIEGLLDQFQFVDGNTIEISGLPYGRYKLIVNAKVDGQFLNEGLTIPITVVRPFYATWWFFLLGLILVGITAFQYYQWRVRRLEERKRELELLVKERTAQIEKDKTIIEKDKAIIEEQAVQLRELDELKSKFFANISHELRTPLTLILAPLKNLLTNNQRPNKEYTQLMLMQQNGQKLLKRINELLDLSRLDANKLEVKEEATFLYPFFKKMLSTFESAANIKDIHLLFNYQLDESTQILTDRDKLEKIVSNFLSNALKFTPKNGKITLNVLKQERQLLISVVDTGIGIPKEDLTKIFDRFYQSQSNQKQQGTGIGLSLCQELSKVLNGRVWATSGLDNPENIRGEIGSGSTFYLELPLIESFAIKETTPEEEPTAMVAPITESIQPRLNRPTVLVVEDNPDLRTYLTLILEEHYQVITAENGEDAARQLGIKNYELGIKNDSGAIPNSKFVIPNLIISDIMMPVMDGMELLTKLKASDQLRHIPVLMLTARKSMEVKLEALRIGVDDYLTKPFTNEEVIARAANLIENSQNRLTATVEDAPPSQPQVSAADLKWIKIVEEYILEHIENPDFKLNDLTNEINLSYSRIATKIKKITGLSPKQYERSLKLDKARELLQSGDITTVSEVMYKLGFENHYYFSKVYKKNFGIMPTEELKKKT